MPLMEIYKKRHTKTINLKYQVKHKMKNLITRKIILCTGYSILFSTYYEKTQYI